MITFRDALREALREEMQRDPKVFIIGEDVGHYGGAYAVTKGLLDEFGPDRVRDAPMSEAMIVGAALGAAMTGMRPVAEIMYVDFMALAMDQFVNQAAKIHYMFGGQLAAPLVVRTQQGTGRGAGAQHSQSLEAWFMHVPGLRVVLPATPRDAKGLLKTAIRQNSPVLFIEHKGLYAIRGEVPENEYLIPFGEADVKRSGRDVTVVAYSRMVHLAMEAAEQLAADGIDAEVLDLRTLNPLDSDTLLTSVRRTGRAVIVHEACRTAGAGAELSALIHESLHGELRAPVRRVAAMDVPIPANSRLEGEVIPKTADVVSAARAVVGGGAPARA